MLVLAIGLFFINISPSHAVWSKPFEVEKDLHEWVAFKAYHKPCCQFENITDRTIDVKIAYITQSESLSQSIASSSKVALLPHQFVLFFPNELNIKNYFISMIEVNDNNVFRYPRIGPLLRDVPPILYFNFCKGSSSDFSKELFDTLNININ